MERSIADVMGFTEQQAALFLKGFSAGMLTGTAMAIALRVPANAGLSARDPGSIGRMFRKILQENRETQFYGFACPLSDDEIDALGMIVTASNGRTFLNNVTLRGCE